MKEFKFAPEIKIGTVFTRIDKNGKVWKAEVINRTEYFVDVKKTQPYQIKICDSEPIRQKKFYNNEWHFKDVGGLFHYEDAKPTFERAEIIEEYVEETTNEIEEDIWGTHRKTRRVKTNNYFLKLKEEYSKYSQYDKLYKYTVPFKNNPAEEGFDVFYKYCEVN